MKNYDEAEKYNREALDLKRAIGDRPEELSSLLNEARIAEGRKQFSQAIAILKQIVAGSEDNLSLKWEAESQLAAVFALRGDNPSAELRYEKALSTIDQARASVTKEEHRLSFLESAEHFYNDYIDFLVSRGRTQDALRLTEHSRARTLAEGLKLPVTKLSESSFNPELTARQTNQVILSYWLKQGNSYLWVVTPSRVTMFALPGADQVEAELRSYRKAIFSPRDPRQTAESSGTALYQLLVEPAQNLIPHGAHVTIVGRGILNTLNFATLLVPNPQLHYWIEDVTISNASSIALLSGTPGRHASVSKALLLIGNPAYTEDEYP